MTIGIFRLNNSERNGLIHDIIGTLTCREREVLELIGRGRVTKEIAEYLGISAETIGNHRKKLCQKLDLHSTAELAACGPLFLPDNARAPESTSIGDFGVGCLQWRFWVEPCAV
jgi:DNA-binding CsgD family transcriptional regulator